MSAGTKTVLSPRLTRWSGKAVSRNKHPIVQPLLQNFLPEDSKTTSKIQSRARLGWQNDIVSEKLCDDVIKFLAPTLEQYRGATIIDVNPGACLWSSKLHDYLQPRRHLLMEPDERYYDPFIKPLLDKPGSKFTHTTLRGTDASLYWSNYLTVWNDPKLLPPQPELKPQDPKLRQLRSDILVTGNLWRLGASRTAINLSSLIVQHMLYGAQCNEIFHKAGLVRMLWWLPEYDLLEMLPLTAVAKKGLAAQIATASELVQVTGNTPLEDYLPLVRIDKRPRHIPDKPLAIPHPGMSKVSKAVSVQGLDRQQLITSVDTDMQKALVGPNPCRTACKTWRQLLKLAEKLRADARFLLYETDVAVRSGRPSKDGIANYRDRVPLSYPQTDAIITCTQWQVSGHTNSSRDISRSHRALVTLLDLELRMLNVEAELAALIEAKRVDADIGTKFVLDLSKELDIAIEHKAPVRTMEQLRISLEFAIAAYAAPATNARERRPFEPLKSEDDEIWPNPAMSLVMMTPSPDEYAVPGAVSVTEASKIYKDFIKQLFYVRSTPLPQVLDRMGPNTAKDLLSQVPSTRDARKGGRVDVNKLSPRMLSSEMLRDLVKAYIDWPFRPSSVELLLAEADKEMSSSAGTEEVGEVYDHNYDEI